MGTDPQQTSSVLVLARTSCTLEGAAGFSAERPSQNLDNTTGSSHFILTELNWSDKFFILQTQSKKDKTVQLQTNPVTHQFQGTTNP